MKVNRIILAFSVVWSCFASAEPYAERGVLAGGMPLAELDPDVKVPDSAEVPIPPPPGAKFISGGGDKFCTMELRTQQSVEDVCDYYESELMRLGYAQVDAPSLNLKGACEIYKDGDMDSNLGIMVEKNEDPMFAENGSTLVAITYIGDVGDSCWD
ncbi:hypothetical protein [Marinobacter salarius]|uniref:hypothetical protein n=1 Tax=Marinobacter salarius TaxID=1420917 RepID=UPI0032129A91